MKRNVSTLALTAGVVVTSITLWAGSGGRLTVATAPPVVISTSPIAGSTDVDPSIKEIRVTFSKRMMDESWSWSQTSAAAFPEVTGDIRYEKDGRTCVLPVSIKPGQTYASWLNTPKFGNFKDRDGRSAVPFLLVFETKKAN